MEIVIVGAAMPFGPETLVHKSLGGSETAQLMLGKKLKEQGHRVVQFTYLPAPGEPDHISSGDIGEDGVRYVDISNYERFISSTEVDLLIMCRTMELAKVNHQAKHAVVWMHDLALHTRTTPEIGGFGWNINEIWCVSQFHKDQFHSVTGYPLERIQVVRNGIVEFDIDMDDLNPLPNQLVYAARPERGLINLIRPGGIMERLPEFNLKVCMYANYPPQMKDLYEFCFSRCAELPNVEMLGSLTQKDLRHLLAESWAYVYPTQFEETSCILAREAVSVGTPFITTKVGALPETLGDSGIFFESESFPGTDEWCQEYADFVRSLQADAYQYFEAQAAGLARVDLTWDGVAAKIPGLAVDHCTNHYSRVWSLIEDSDIYAAKAYLESLTTYSDMPDALHDLHGRLRDLYPYIYGDCTFDEYYERYYIANDEKHEDSRCNPLYKPLTARVDQIIQELRKLPPGSKVLDYGCAEGSVLLFAAQACPQLNFVGVDFADSNVQLLLKHAAEFDITNVDAYFGSSENWPVQLQDVEFDAAICSEVLEHVAEPWKLAEFVEAQVREGGRIIITVPAGPWEAIGLQDKDQYWWRAHVWHIDIPMLRTMFDHKPNNQMVRLPSGHGRDLRAIGHTIYCYDVDYSPVGEQDPWIKANQHHARETLGACIIAKNCEHTIGKTLKSIAPYVAYVQIAIEKCSDNTLGVIESFANNHPWVQVNVVERPPIKAREFGFDDARNVSIEGCPTDWILWIDTDEFLIGRSILRYTVDNAVDSYAIHQHHFSIEPRGVPAQIDRPARLFRNNGKFKFVGKVHEHAEVADGGPGYSMLLPDLDISHMGYENEEVRQGRFWRNFPFLEWDREVNPNRDLGVYLWLRDIIHRMRHEHQVGNFPAAQTLAGEAIDFYDKNWESTLKFGEGMNLSVAYVGEAMRYLGRGLDMSVTVQLGQNQIQLQGCVEDARTITRVVDNVVNKELDKRKSGYW